MRKLLAIVLSCALLVQPSLLLAQTDRGAIVRYNSRHHPVIDTEGMVASQNAIASQVGAAILADGGNAVDAAIGVGFALAVVLPRAGNIGGGGFMLAYLAESDETIAIDYREMAPPRANRDMFLDENGDVDPTRARFSHLSSGVPGTVAGLWEAHQRYGSMPWERLVQPSVDLARDGIVVSHDLANLLASRQERLSRYPAARAYFYKPDGSPYAAGDVLVQADLAESLELIANEGRDAFYKGSIAKLIAAEMAANGGLIDEEALARYEPTFREPVRGAYRGYEVVSMPPSSSGGVHIIQMLNILENFPMSDFGAGSADSVHVLTEAMKLAYADRSKHLGDMDFYDVPIDWLTDESYGRDLAESIDMQKARRSVDIAPGEPAPYESPDTTHFSVMDSYGNAVSNTYTLNFSYGSHIAVSGAGFLLNNEMDDFSSKPGVPNAFGLIGGEANAIEAGKRPLSSMTPTMIFFDGEPWLVTGSPGGSRIITTVLQMIVNVIDHGMNIADATSVARIHHQWLPDVLRLESGFSPDTVRELERRGHQVQVGQAMGSLQSVIKRDENYRGFSDPRRPQAGSVGPAMLKATQ